MKTLNLSIAALGLLCAETILMMPSAHALQQLFCNGQMNNGWSYSAEYVDGQFTRIRWTRQGKPPQTTNLTYESINNKDQPVYRGGLMGALGVTLIDLSGGDVGLGSKISITVDDWGRSQATCGTTSSSQPDTTVLAFQTKNYRVDVYRRNGRLLMDVFDKRNRRKLINGGLVQAASRRGSDDNWTSYVYRGEITIYARSNPIGNKELELIQTSGRRVIEPGL